MRRKYGPVVLPVVLALLATGSGAQSVGSSRQVTWNALIRSVEGVPVARAVVTVVTSAGSGAQIASAASELNGRFAVVLEKSSARITVSATGYSPWFGHFDGSRLPPETITLVPGATVLGTVADENGLPLSGAFVDVLYDVSRLPFTPPVDTDGGARISRSDGTFRVVNVAADIPFRLELSRGRIVIGRFGPYTAGSGSLVTVNLQVQSLSQIRGLVESKPGGALANARVRLMRLNPDSQFVSMRPLTLLTETDDRGHFVFPPALAGEFRLLVSKAGFAKQDLRVTSVATSALQDVRISLSR